MAHAGLLRPKESGTLVSQTGPGFRRMHNVILHDGRLRRLDCCHEEILCTTGATSLEAWEETRPSWDEVVALSEAVVERYIADGTFERDKDPKTGDIDFENSQIRNEVYLLYEEITYGMNQGDVGRVEEALVSWIFIFKATGKHKYASQMEKFLLNVHFLYPPRLRYAARYNWMCNPTGRPGAFRGVDWMVERNNLYTKHIYGGRFSNNTVAYMLKESSLIEIYHMLHVNIEDNFCLTNRTINHAKPNMTNTYNKVNVKMQKYCPHEYQPTRRTHHALENLVQKGDHMMQAQTAKAIQVAEGHASEMLIDAVEDSVVVVEDLDEGVDADDLAV
ncbi:hypothetical protein OF83DRAFT_1179950 [Amylostereum chailletii]|nr:hypothetical protein OF83DRAFT_1179950 [Amylostereum chailletii]